MKKENKGLIVIIIILIIIIVFGLSGYIVYDKFLIEEVKNEEQQEAKEGQQEAKEELVKGNIFKLNDIACSVDDSSNCIKTTKVAYNNENHEISLKLLEIKNNIAEYTFEVYIDNESVGSLDAGRVADDSTFFENGFDATIYVIDSKYLAILTPNLGIKVDYVLNFFNETVKHREAIIVVDGEQTLCKDESCNEILNEIDNLEFNGTVFKFWGQSCDFGNVKYQIKYDGNSIEETIIEKLGTDYGASPC